MCTGSIPIAVQNMIDARISWMICFLSNIGSTMCSVEPLRAWKLDPRFDRREGYMMIMRMNDDDAD